MVAETQNTNVPACRFYRGQGFHLGAIHRYGYVGAPSEGDPSVAAETMLLWYLDL
jgi:ribosomal protein S18 acetylase RimI-like enzyme